ncbi:SPFH domain-containing protein [Acanthopleuribacter pedis]|uniref:SPFH domain-containing protein n=1 Tax=Acanthopleuribacter pedis TaxID=442870 RepID=UPI003C6F6000
MVEKQRKTLPGIPFLAITITSLIAVFILFVTAIGSGAKPMVVLTLFLGLLNISLFAGFFYVAPNRGKVLTLFGKYKGTCREPGLHWANIFFAKQDVSLRVHNFDTNHLKVNDQTGNPIEIGAVVVWRVVDTAEAVFEVENFSNYVHVQSEAALRGLATRYPYVAYEEDTDSLTGNMESISEQLKAEIQERLAKAGVDVLEARISHLAYAPEIAAAMLQRQQASAVVAARTEIVEGAVGMVELALQRLKDDGMVQLDAEKQAAMVSNLMVVLCSDRAAQPVINTTASPTPHPR